MNTNNPSNPTHHSRRIVERVVISGQLKLITPTSLGNGDSDGLLDMPLTRDVAENKPLLTGSSLAGALRNYLRLRESGYRQPEQNGRAADLFGGQQGDDNGSQSPLIVDDAFAEVASTTIRDNVRIDPQTRTAQDKKKFDLELLPAGTTFHLRFELVITEKDNREELLETLALALTGFEQKEIALGTRKRRGFGRCVVEGWQVQRYDLREPAGLLAWLAAGLDDNGDEWGLAPVVEANTAAEALGVSLPNIDHRKHITITAQFALASPLLIRSEEPLPVILHRDDYKAPDGTHLHTQSKNNGNGTDKVTPLLPGTSLAGALRARAQKILNTLLSCKGIPQDKASTLTSTLIDGIFGSDMDLRPTQKYASRLIVEERDIDITEQQEPWLVQQRVSIDRFTGGALDTALFSETPLTGGKVGLELTLQGYPNSTNPQNKEQQPSTNPQNKEQQHSAEVGLLLLLLKDLWTSDLPLGGTSSIGRGMLRGTQATIQDTLSNSPRCWELTQTETEIQVQQGNSEDLETYVDHLLAFLGIEKGAKTSQ